MDDSKKRTISFETLEMVKDKINPALLSALPASPEEILTFAKEGQLL